MTETLQGTAEFDQNLKDLMTRIVDSILTHECPQFSASTFDVNIEEAYQIALRMVQNLISKEEEIKPDVVPDMSVYLTQIRTGLEEHNPETHSDINLYLDEIRGADYIQFLDSIPLMPQSVAV